MIKLLEIVKNMHNAGIVNVDIKPENIRAKNNKLHLLNFGSSLEYMTLEEGKTTCMAGTPMYTSTFQHNY